MLAFLKVVVYTKIEMGYLEEMLLRNGVLYHAPDGSTSRIEGSILSNSLVVINGGRVTHRIVRASNGVDIIAINTSTRLVDAQFRI